MVVRVWASFWRMHAGVLRAIFRQLLVPGLSFFLRIVVWDKEFLKFRLKSWEVEVWDGGSRGKSGGVGVVMRWVEGGEGSGGWGVRGWLFEVDIRW